nr:hypothetical protein [uncultured Pseudomonas sp.]
MSEFNEDRARELKRRMNDPSTDAQTQLDCADELLDMVDPEHVAELSRLDAFDALETVKELARSGKDPEARRLAKLSVKQAEQARLAQIQMVSGGAKQLSCNDQNDRLLAELLLQGVRFIVVGGLAVRFHVLERKAHDLDLLIESTPENASRVFRALQALGLNPGFGIELIAKASLRPQQMPLKDGFDADLLTTGPDVNFSDEWEHAGEALIKAHRIRYASKALLIRMKQNTGRDKDLADIVLLESD